LCDWSSGENWKHGWLLDSQLASYAGIREEQKLKYEDLSLLNLQLKKVASLVMFG
jgi:hypothetical protein